MVYGIYLSAGGLQVNQYRQAVLANNLANASTPGFKPDIAVIRERKVESQEDVVDPAWSDRVLDGMTGGSLVAPTYTSFEAGPIQRTGQPLDVAIEGDGFFVVRDGDAERYTRDGRFMLDAQGQLVTAGGRLVLDDQGQPVVVPAEAKGRVRIEPSGEVTAGGVTVGKIATVVVEDPSQLRKAGGNLWQALGAEPTPVSARLRVGEIEGSAVDPLQTMVSLMQAARAYEFNATLVGLADATLGRAVNDLGRVR